MHITELFQTIIESDPQDHWQRFEYKNAERAIFKGDVNLRIECGIDSDVINDDFKEEWANKHPDKHAESYSHNIYYGASLVTYVILVSVDGGRARLPLPDTTTMTPDILAYRVAEIFDTGSFHEYMGRAGLKTPEEA